MLLEIRHCLGMAAYAANSFLLLRLAASICYHKSELCLCPVQAEPDGDAAAQERKLNERERMELANSAAGSDGDESGGAGGTVGPGAGGLGGSGAGNPRDISMLRACRSVECYEQKNKISEGTYGVVYRSAQCM